MKLEQPVNANYAAVVVKITAINKLENCQNVVGVPVLGYQAIVSKDTQIGDIGIVFPAETQLSDEFCRMNNLYRHSENNADPQTKGYIEDNRRVKAMRFRGHRSDALFMPVDSLFYTGFETGALKVGDVFDKLRSHEICQKYVVKTASGKAFVAQPKKERRVEEKLFPQHYDTANYWRNKDSIPDNAFITVTQKLHGTSLRATNNLVKRRLNWKDRIAKKLGVSVQQFEYANVYGSRKVIKDSNDPSQNHYYDHDLWSAEGSKLDGFIPKGYVVYGELIGWVGDKPIQSGYTYCVQVGTCELYIYRVAKVNPDGYMTDLAWEQVKEFTKNNGLKHVPELWSGCHSDFDADMFMDMRYHDIGYVQAVPLDPGKTVDEGCVIRSEGLVPTALKAKSPLFFEHETKLLDKGVVDMESAE